MSGESLTHGTASQRSSHWVFGRLILYQHRAPSFRHSQQSAAESKSLLLAVLIVWVGNHEPPKVRYHAVSDLEIRIT
jgi:hypothetical protein